MRPVALPAAERYQHGTRSRYVTGCRCSDCRAANARSYHERQARAKEAAAEVLAPLVPQPQTYTAADGSKRVRLYQRACPGPKGRGCPKRSHLRKDSTGGVCGHCRGLLVWNGLVSTLPVRRHLEKLSKQGVGYKTVADAADVGHTTLAGVMSGRRKRIRALAAKRVRAVTVDAIADHGLVDAADTWKLIDELITQEWFTKAELARRLGMKTPALQIRKARILAKTAQRVRALYRRVMH